VVLAVEVSLISL